MTKRSQFGATRWKCVNCGARFTRIGPKNDSMHKPQECHGCAAKFGTRDSSGLRKERRPRKLHS